MMKKNKCKNHEFKHKQMEKGNKVYQTFFKSYGRKIFFKNEKNVYMNDKNDSRLKEMRSNGQLNEESN